MIKSLRRKFIAIAMGSMTLVLIILIGGINILNYINVNESADARLQILADNQGVFPMEPFINDERLHEDNRPNYKDRFSESFPEMPPKPSTDSSAPSNNDTHDIADAPYSKPDKTGKMHHSISVETPFDTRYFTVTLDEEGTVISLDIGRIAAVSEDLAISYATTIYIQGKTNGFIGNYKYTVLDNKTYIFLDCSRELDSFYTFLKASILISILGLLLVLFLVIIFSKIVLRPVAESYEKQKRFITDASHEIKTPLTIIDANTEILEMEQGENEWTQSIRNQIKRLTSLTEKLVFLSRMDEEQSTLTMLDFSLSDAVSETVEPFVSLATTKKKQIHCEIEPNISTNGNETSIRQVVSLLLDNAIKYTPENEVINVKLSTSSKGKTLIISNPADDLHIGKYDILFERFYRPDTSRSSSTGGYGIGLSVVKAIVLAHKGKITAKSDDGKVLQFIITLPY